MKHIVFTPDRNKIGSDFVGAFEPEALRYATYWKAQGDTVEIHPLRPMHSAAYVRTMLDAIKAAAPVDRLVFFCHGWKTGIQLGLSCDGTSAKLDLLDFATEMEMTSTPSLKVALYACSTGASSSSPSGDGGFADSLRDALCMAGRPDVTVFAHSTAGHASRNENVRFFAGHGNHVGGVGGDDIVAHKTPEFKRLYKRLHVVSDPLRWRLPYMTPDEIHAELK